ncbi:MAG: NUDIX hydrolase [Actinomycetota bacterium]|nr:NUDIX hydrolase [Actinomycetota bacterium]
MSGFSKHGERVVHRGQVVTLVEATFVDPDGETFEREVVHHPGAVSVVPVLDDSDTVVLVRQYRAAVETELLEIPAGKLDVDGEGREPAAARELEEEVGYRAGRLEKLAEFYNSAGYCDERSTVFLGLDLEACEVSAQGVEERHMTIEQVSLAEVPAMVADGRLLDAKTIIGLALARERLYSLRRR